MHYTIIVNPVSGKLKGRKILSLLTPILRAHQIDHHSIESCYPGHPADIAREVDLSKSKALLVIGGDGTMHEVINGMLTRQDGINLPIGLIPGGTGNALMHDIGILDPVKALQNILEGSTTSIDLMEISTPDERIFAFNIVGWGLPVTINHYAERMRFLGGQRYNIASIIEILKNTHWYVIFKMDDHTIEGEFSFFLACNTVHSGNGMRVAPPAIFNDGYVDIIILKQGKRTQLLSLFAKIFGGKHMKNPLIQHHRVKSFEIITKKKSTLNIDGQVAGITPIKVKVVQGKIDIFSSVK